MFFGNHNKNFICRRCLNSYTIEQTFINHKENCGDYDISTTRTSSEFHLKWKGHFHKLSLCFMIIADFEAGNEIDNSSIENNTTNIYKQNLVCNGYYILSELEDVLKSGYYNSNLEYNYLNWFVYQVINVENKMASCFKNTEKDVIKTNEDEESFENFNTFRFYEKVILIDNNEDHCHLIGKYKGPAHNNCNIHVTQKQSRFFPFALNNFSNYDCHLFSKKLDDKKMIKQNLEVFQKQTKIVLVLQVIV